MELDANINAIIVNGKKDFNLGTDYLCKLYTDLAYKGQENPKETEEYLRKLYSMIFDISKLETPFIPIINGRAYGSGATIAGLSHFGIATGNACAAFPETNFGFVPTGGSSYLLSRMPNEIGLYLALTGEKVFGADLEQLNLAYKTSSTTSDIAADIQNMLNTRYQTYNTKIMYGDA